MQIAEYKPISTRTDHRIIHHDEVLDENDHVISESYDETVEVEVPVMGLVYRDMTPEEIAQAEEYAANIPEPEPTPEERLSDVEQTQADIMDAMIELASLLSQ